MTLLIAFILIYNFNMASIWYVVAFLFWLGHLVYHGED